jgi:hypothetical protein
MPDPDPLTDALARPKRTKVGNEEIEEHSIPEIQAAIKAKNANANTAAGKLPVRTHRIRPGGTTE